MKHILILISFFFIFSLLYGKSKKNGLLYTWKNGSTYVGEWKDDKKNGQGKYIYGKGNGEGDKYEGEWKDDKKNGQGTYFFPDGGKLVGEFRKDSPWNITDYDKNGKIKGKYVNGVRQ